MIITDKMCNNSLNAMYRTSLGIKASTKCKYISVIITGCHENVNCGLILFSCPQISSLSGSSWQEVAAPLGTWKLGKQTCTCLLMLKRFRKPLLKVSNTHTHNSNETRRERDNEFMNRDRCKYNI